MFAMMRSLGFRLNHIIQFVMVQAFTFSIPGMLIGVAIAYVFNTGLRLLLFATFENFTTYAMSRSSVFLGIVLFGVFVPLISIVGPTRFALGKNLRTSLDATRRNNTTEDEASVTFRRLKDISFSFTEVGLGISLTTLGFIVYVFLPGALITDHMTVFFLIMNLVLISIAIGLSFIATIILPPLQIAVLKIIMCLSWKNRCLEVITRKRLDSMRSRNTKISIMITGAISFLMFEAGSYLSTNDSTKKLYDFIVAGDIIIKGFVETIYLHEIPLSNYLDE